MEEVTAPMPLSMFPWEGKEPIASAYGFTLAGVLFKLHLGYVLYKEGVLLYCTEKYADNEIQVWRRHWASYEAAVASAENLAGDAEDYFESLRIIARPDEDLNFDDFLEHLALRLNNGFHYAILPILEFNK